MTHAAVVWRDTIGERQVYGASDTRRMEFSFYGYYKHAKGGAGTAPPADSIAAIAAAESSGANLRIDGEYVGPTGTYAPSGSTWILSGLRVETVADTNPSSDVVWMFNVTLEAAYQASTTEPFVTCTTQAGSKYPSAAASAAISSSVVAGVMRSTIVQGNGTWSSIH